MAQRLKHLPAMRETWVRSLGREVPLEKEMATHSSILAWRIPRMEVPGGYSSRGCKGSDTTERQEYYLRADGLYWVNSQWIRKEVLMFVLSSECIRCHRKGKGDSHNTVRCSLKACFCLLHIKSWNPKGTLWLSVLGVHNWTKNSFDLSIRGKTFSILQKFCF